MGYGADGVGGGGVWRGRTRSPAGDLRRWCLARTWSAVALSGAAGSTAGELRRRWHQHEDGPAACERIFVVLSPAESCRDREIEEERKKGKTGNKHGLDRNFDPRAF
jgi:hypothetical protein